MKRSIVSSQEYDRLVKLLDFYDTTRNHLLSFSFTAVLAIIGAALAIETDKLNVWLYLMPYFLIIPFTARIAYYRLASAHINSFLKEFAWERMIFPKGTEVVKEGCCKRYEMIAWLINHEMVMLAAAVTIIFYLKYFGFPSRIIISPGSCADNFALILPIILLGVVYSISDATYSYKDLMDNFAHGWHNYMPPIAKQNRVRLFSPKSKKD